MRSIRKRLVVWLLLGLATLWATAGAGVYFAVRKGEIARMDAKLENLSNGVRFFGSMVAREAARGPGIEGPPRPERTPERPERPDRGENGERDDRSGGRERSSSFFQEDGREFFEIWSLDQTPLERRSPSLGDYVLPRPEEMISREPVFYDTEHPDGTRLRGMAFEFRPWGRGRPRPGDSSRRPAATPLMKAVVAVDAEPAHATLTTLVLGITGVGFLAALASVGLVHFALKDGLRPLDRLGNQLAEVDAQSLDGRFSSNSLPTELAPICDRLNALMGRLETSFERERRFSADLAHELRTPVAELRTMAEVELRWPDGGDREQNQQTLEIAEQMGGIIESLLALGRLENGQSDIEPEPVDLAELAESCWRPFADTASERGVGIDLDLLPGQVIKTDPKMLRLIVSNLFSNAAEYTPSGGQIKVLAEDGSLTVSNDAPDLDAEAVSHLFERFWRADGSRTDGSHSGLGLSLARACARALALKLSANYDSGRLVFRLFEETPESSPASSSDNLAVVE